MALEIPLQWRSETDELWPIIQTCHWRIQESAMLRHASSWRLV
jgi:hypothetical protein